MSLIVIVVDARLILADLLFRWNTRNAGRRFQEYRKEFEGAASLPETALVIRVLARRLYGSSRKR